MAASRILVTGAGGFIGHHLVKRLKAEGNWVRGADIKLQNMKHLRQTNSKFSICGNTKIVCWPREAESIRFTTSPQTWAESVTSPLFSRIFRATIF